MWTYKLDWACLQSIETVAKLRTSDLIFVFGQTESFAETNETVRPHLHELSRAAPHAIIVGASTGSSISNQILHEEGVQALAVGFDKVTLRQAAEPVETPDESFGAGKRLGQNLMSPELRHVLILSKGLDINGSQLVNGVMSEVGDRVTVSGGLAGDGARFGTTFVLMNGLPNEHIVTAVGFYGDALRVGIATGGGWREFGPQRSITRSEGSTLIELDGTPALDLYIRYLGDEAVGLPASALIYPLKIHDPDFPDREMVRTVLSVDMTKRTLTFAGDMPEGWQARLMRGQFDDLVEGAERAAQNALMNLRRDDPDLEPGLSLMVSCVGRRLLMGQRTADEVEAVSAILGESVSQAGFYSYGEIAPHAGTTMSSLHNQTVCLTLLSEVM